MGEVPKYIRNRKLTVAEYVKDEENVQGWLDSQDVYLRLWALGFGMFKEDGVIFVVNHNDKEYTELEKGRQLIYLDDSVIPDELIKSDCYEDYDDYLDDHATVSSMCCNPSRYTVERVEETLDDYGFLAILQDMPYQDWKLLAEYTFISIPEEDNQETINKVKNQGYRRV